MNYSDADFDNLNILLDDKGLIINIDRSTKHERTIKSNPKTIISLSEKLPPELCNEWGDVLKVLETKAEGFGFSSELNKLGFENCYSKINPGQFSLIFLCLRKWDLGAEWFVQKSWLGKTHKPPIKRSIFNQYESFGNVLTKLLPLAERCHTLSSFLKPETLPYKTQRETLSVYFMERKAADIRGILNRPIYNTESSFPNTPIGKTKRIKSQKEVLKQLKALKNPFVRNNPYQTNRYCLIDAAIQLVNRGLEAFKNDFWNPYIQAEEAWYQYQVENCQDYWIEVDKEKYSLCTRKKGRGGAKIKMPFVTKL
jgi:hypothetical protein